jgi:hypothetical protein
MTDDLPEQKELEPGTIGRLSARKKAVVVAAVMDDPELWAVIERHYADAQWPADYHRRLQSFARRFYPEADLGDLALILANLRSAAGLQPNEPAAYGANGNWPRSNPT